MRLPNGYGSVSKLSGKRRNSYQVRITIGRDETTGECIRKPLGYYRTKDEALEALREYNANPYNLTAEKLTFSDVYNRWVESDSFKELGEKAADHYRLAYEHCAPLHGLPILDIHLLQLQTLMDTCELDYTPKKYIRELCQKLFTFAERYGAVNDNPALRVDIGKRKRKISSSSPIKNKKNEQITLFDLELSKEPAVQEAQQSISEIDGMDGHEFEYFCAELMEKNGFKNVTVTKASGDQGVDILAQKDGIKYAVQCKNYASPLGNTPIQKVNTGKTYYHCHVGVVMTNSTFTSNAVKLAEATGVLLWDGDKIREMMQKG